MPPPSRSFTVITNGQVDADSPINDVLMSALQGNLIHLEEWLGDGYTAAVDHDHDGANSKTVVGLGVLVGSTWPSFHVHVNGATQADITGAQLKSWSAEEFDTNSDFDLTAEEFLPTVPGKYLLTASVAWQQVTGGDQLILYLYKNGAEYKKVSMIAGSAVDDDNTQMIAAVVDANGTDDDFRIYVENVDRNTSDISGAIAFTYFSGCRIG